MPSAVNSVSIARASFSRSTPGFSATASSASGGSGGTGGGPASPQAATSRAGSTAARKLGDGTRGIGAGSSSRHGVMPTNKRGTIGRPRRRTRPRVLLAGSVLAGAAGWLYREPIGGYDPTGPAFGART